MKRWAWLGLVGLLAACKEEPPVDPPDTTPQDCTTTGEQGLTSSQGLGSEELDNLDGRQSYLIRYRRSVSAMAARAAEDSVVRTGGKVSASWANLGAVAARLTPEQRAALAKDPDVLTLEPDRVVRAFGRQALNTVGTEGELTEGLRLVQAPQVWDSNPADGTLDAAAPNGTGIKVCVIDSGWDNRHPELVAAYAGGKDFVDNDDEPLDYDKTTGTWGGGHGTHTAATIAAQLGSHGTVQPGDEANGVAGVAPGVELYVARVLNTRGNGSTADIISALQWCQEQKVQIVSLSLGAPDSSTTEEAAFKVAISAGILPIAATGNSGTGDPATEPPVAFPAGYDGVLAVGAVDFKSARASFSQVGPEVALMGPGVDVLSAMILGSESYSQINVDGQTYESRSLAFAPTGEYTGKLLTCGLGDGVTSCGQEATCAGFVAYVDRGGLDSEGNGLTFAKKVNYMRRAGAKAVIIGNNDKTDGVGNFTLGTPDTWLPTASVSFDDGAAIKGLRNKDAKVKLVGVDYARLSGTSMATPHVSGVAALVWSAKPSLTAAQVRALLQDSAKDLGALGRDNIYGYGLVQAKSAMDLLQTRFP